MVTPIRQAQAKGHGNILLPLVSGIAVFAIVIAVSLFLQNQKILEEREPTPGTVAAPKNSIGPSPKVANWSSFTFKENPISFKYPADLTISYFPTDTSGKAETDRMASNENVILKNGSVKIIGINPNQVGIGGIPGPDYTQTTASVNGYTATKLTKTDGTFFTTIPYQEKVLMASCFAQGELCDQILSTLVFSSQVTTAPPAQIKQVAKKLAYALPQDWTSFRDRTGKIEVGYDSRNNTAVSYTLGTGVSISGKFGVISSAGIDQYDGGSRHSNLYKRIGLTPEELRTNLWKHPEFHEEEYLYNGWSCLILIGVDISQYPQVWGICPLNSQSALYFNTWGLDNGPIERFLQTIKVL